MHVICSYVLKVEGDVKKVNCPCVQDEDKSGNILPCPESKDTSRVGPKGNVFCLLWRQCRRPWSVTCASCSRYAGRTGFVWVRRVWNGSAEPKSCQMRGEERTSHLPNEHGWRVKIKVDGSVVTLNIKHFLLDLHVLYLYFPVTGVGRAPPILNYGTWWRLVLASRHGRFTFGSVSSTA
jgi:hypothetical protein